MPSIAWVFHRRFALGTVLVGIAAAMVWHPVPALSTSRLLSSDAVSSRYFDVDTSTDGLIAYAVVAPGIYRGKTSKSTDGGLTWSELSSSPAGIWNAVSTSADGLKVAIAGSIDATANGHALYVSLNGGTTWTRHGTQTEAYDDVAISADGSTIVVARPSGLEISTDGGANWSTTAQAADDVALSADGSTIVASEYSNKVWRSLDAGSTWTELAGATPTAEWQDIAISNDGETVFAAVKDDQGYIWKGRSGTPTRYATGSIGFGSNHAVRAAISPDGNSFIAGRYGNTPRVLRNWDRTTDPATLTWESQATSMSVLGLSIADAGTRFIVATEGGGIWIYVPSVPTPTISGADRTDCPSTLTGPATGGTPLRITGQFLFDGTVTVGGVEATVTSSGSYGNYIDITVPAGVAGASPIVVTTESGSATASDTFTYLPSPTGWDRVGATLSGDPYSELGYRVALSADGTVAAAGAQYAEIEGNSTGFVRVWTRSGNTWTQRGGDIVGEEDGELVGFSLAMSADGNTVVVGAPGFDGLGSNRGQARVYQWSGASWNQVGAAIEGSDNSSMGYSVAMSADGDTFLVSTPELDLARVYRWDGSAWNQLGGDITDPVAPSEFGYSNAMSANGETVVISEPFDDVVRVFRWSGTSWSQLGADISGGSGAEGFGYAVSVSADGNTIAVSDPEANGSLTDNGIVRVFEFDGTSWTQRGADFEGTNGAYLGMAIDLSDDGNVLAYTAWEACRYEYSGELVIWTWNGSAWVQKGDFIPTPTSGGGFGFGLALDGPGTIVMTSDSYANSYRGEAFVWQFRSSVATNATASSESVTVVENVPANSTPVIAPLTKLPETGYARPWAAALLMVLGFALIGTSRRQHQLG